MFIHVFTLTVFSLLPVINPLAAAALMLSMSKDMPPKLISRQINLASFYLLTILTLTFFVGTSILNSLGISVSVIKLLGGVIVGLIGVGLLFHKDNHTQQLSHRENFAFYPLNIPMMCGPGTIILLITGAAHISDSLTQVNRLEIYFSILLAFVAISIISWGILMLAVQIKNVIGQRGIYLITKAMGAMLIYIGINLITSSHYHCLAGAIRKTI
ncbi:MarC family protein [Aeromonas veronii]|uniref:MarC family protein n=1 Tax=Aeromonas veronii TaxID=654 RepID=UPI001115FE8C|nr:MarC family protein [Aeromonas veronii]TNI02201.1 stress protection protein MarC [Aeromonas veronii]HDO1313986.1 stress protection protein MarC [Aeromonas veronii]